MDSKDSVSETAGKKIFFLYPSVVVQNRIIPELVQQEFEVYAAKDKETLRRVLKKYPGSIVFADINEHMPEKDWEVWINIILNSPETKSIAVGIITSHDNELMKRKYLLTIKVRNYTIIKSDLGKAITHILEVLQSLDAKGRRKFIRASTERETNTTINIPINGMFTKGMIKDISVVGVSCTIEGSPDIAKNSLLKDIQIKLQTTILNVEGIYFGSRMEGNEKIYVILFTQRVIPDVRIRIRKFIQQHLQAKMDKELR